MRRRDRAGPTPTHAEREEDRKGIDEAGIASLYCWNAASQDKTASPRRILEAVMRGGVSYQGRCLLDLHTTVPIQPETVQRCTKRTLTGQADTGSSPILSIQPR